VTSLLSENPEVKEVSSTFVDPYKDVEMTEFVPVPMENIKIVKINVRAGKI